MFKPPLKISPHVILNWRMQILILHDLFLSCLLSYNHNHLKFSFPLHDFLAHCFLIARCLIAMQKKKCPPSRAFWDHLMPQNYYSTSKFKPHFVILRATFPSPSFLFIVLRNCSFSFKYSVFTQLILNPFRFNCLSPLFYVRTNPRSSIINTNNMYPTTQTRNCMHPKRF